MGQALYRKYRSRSFDEVIGQDHIVKTLQNALKSGRISHAYLFTGSKGVGKTSVARLLAHEVNGLEYKDDSFHLDIIEIDAASNRRIDEIRELRERVHIAPTSAKYKVYIIDEVHMLTREAFNALLKTLEEPPAHCIFILATTEAHKLPETIVSRTQHFNFKPIDQAAASKHLQNLAKKEKIDIDGAALELLAQHGSGSFRDSISLLDQLSGLGGKITEKQVSELLGLPPESTIKKMLDSIDGGDAQAVAKSLDELRAQGVNAALAAKALGGHLRESLASGRAGEWVANLLRQLSQVAASANPQEMLEIDLLETANLNRPPSEPTPRVVETIEPEEPEPVEPPEEETPEIPKLTKPASSGEFSLADWPTVIDKVKTEAASLYTALRLADPHLNGQSLTLNFQFPLHAKKLTQAKSIELIGRIIEETTGAKVDIKCEVDKDFKPAKAAPITSTSATVDSDSLQTISNIFGATEVLES